MTFNDPGWVSATPMPPPGQPKGGKTLLIVGIVALVVVVVAVVIVIAVSSGGSKSVTTDTTVDTTPASTDTSTTSTAASTDTAATPVTHPQELAMVLPIDVDVSKDCGPVKPLPTGLEAASANYGCDVKGLGSGAQVFAYQFPSTGEYEAALVAYNKFKQFDPATAAKGCPPDSSGVGVDTWHDGRGDSGTLECLTLDNNSPTYIWTVPADNAILEASGPPNSAFSALQTWWHQYA